MRITRQELFDALESAAKFNQIPLTFVGRSRAFRGAEEKIRDQYGFVPACKYGRGMLPLSGEFGTNGKTRFLFRE